MATYNTQFFRYSRLQLLFMSLLASGMLTACGGGGGGDPAPPANLAPVANAGADQTAVEGSQINLVADASTDSDGSIASYSWTQTAGSPLVSLNDANTATASFTIPDIVADTMLTFQVTVTDNDGAAATDMVVISATAIVNQLPTANAGADQSATEREQISISGAASSDPNGSIVSYAWAQTGGTPTGVFSSTSAADTMYTIPNIAVDTVFELTLTVTDNDGASASDTITISATSLPNLMPTANAGSDQTVPDNEVAQLNGSGLDTDGTIASYAWTQAGGTPTVTISAANQAMASFIPPDITTDTVLAFELEVTDNEGATATDTVFFIITPATDISVSGKVTYEHLEHTLNNGLDYNAPSIDPVVGATVQLLNASGVVLDSMPSDSEGNYSFIVTPNTQVRVRVRAETISTTGATWDTRVVDNTSNGALYVLDGSLSDTGTVNSTRDLFAASGWNIASNSYTGTRSAGPFAILASVYGAIQTNVAVDGDANFPALRINWSTNNEPADCAGGLAVGCIGTSFFNGSEIYILGSANADTDEYDGHVVVHEWGHYFEGQLSRSDSIGGPHSGGDRLDVRVAMGEGFGNAFSAIVTNDTFYRDSFGPAQATGFSINVESNNGNGWFDESTVQGLLYDWFDSTDDGSDNLTLGWAPLYTAFTNTSYRDELALTSIFSFITELKSVAVADAAEITTMAATRGVNGTDEFGAGETRLPFGTGTTNDILPLYTVLTADGTTTTVCSINTHGTGNKLSTRRFLRLNLPTAGGYRIRASGGATGDPDLLFHQAGRIVARIEAVGPEDRVGSFQAGDYIVEAYDFCNVAPGESGCPADGNARYCIDISIN